MGLYRVSFTQLRSFAHLRLAQGSSHESLEMRLKWHILLKNEMLKVSLAKAWSSLEKTVFVMFPCIPRAFGVF